MAEISNLKKEIQQCLSDTELQIFKLEEEYYNKTIHGNLMKGYENYGDHKTDSRAIEKKKVKMDPEHRWFSYSSWKFFSEHPTQKSGGQGDMDNDIPSARSHRKAAGMGERSISPMEAPTKVKDKAGSGVGRKKKRKKKNPYEDDYDE